MISSPRILVLRAGAIGDTLMVTPLVRALRRTFPEAHLSFLCSRPSYQVLCCNPHLDRVIPLRYRHLPLWASPEKWLILRSLNHFPLDAVIVLENHKDFLALAGHLKARRLITYGVPSGRTNFERVLPDPQLHAVENHLRAGQLLGVQPAGLEMELHYPPEADQAVHERLSQAGIAGTDRLIGVHPGWGRQKHHPSRTSLRGWPADRFVQVIQWLVKEGGARVMLTGSSDDYPLAQYIARKTAVPVLNLAGKLSLLELAALIRRLTLYLTIDSGPAHMAAALDCPQITLCGPAILSATAPRSKHATVRLLQYPVPCAPCYGTPRKSSCRDNICMKGIQVSDVLKALEEILPCR